MLLSWYLEDESYKKLEEAQMKPILFMGNPRFGITDHQVAKNTHMVCSTVSLVFNPFFLWFFLNFFFFAFGNWNQVQHAYPDHYMNGLYAGYAPHPMVSPLNKWFDSCGLDNWSKLRMGWNGTGRPQGSNIIFPKKSCNFFLLTFGGLITNTTLNNL